jgi:Protein of unknown function (DUF2835)
LSFTPNDHRPNEEREGHGMKRYEFHLRITPTQYLDYYRGTIRHVIARCTTGQTVQFPASLLQKFVSPEGITGKFALTCDDNNKGLELQRIES